ncbi:hypothetical protein AB0O07_26790 [Streptomyces sp. NPDC093085]|uniref:hypothetical protein n=1 Tax=Streptomyces sp. NPDC093085 TaxID=3155068 RepID=UPI0034164586
MSAARHYFSQGSLSTEELTTDIEADVMASRNAQKALEAAGQHRVAATMADAVDEYLDELSDARKGTWFPRHGQ